MLELVRLDQWIREWVVAHRVHALNGVIWALSAVAQGGILWLMVGATIAWRQARWRNFGTLLLSVSLAGLVSDIVLKPAIGRERPYVSAPAVRVIGSKPNDASFPSGHAASSFAAAFVLSTTAPAARTIWWLLAVAIAYSRIYLGVHYPLDVLVGALVGLVCAAVVLTVNPFRIAAEDGR